MRCLGRVAFLLLLATSAASAQVKETIDVHLVEVPVTVIDRAGNPVRGLTPANFELFDQATKRDVGNFEAIDFESETIRSVAAQSVRAAQLHSALRSLLFVAGRTQQSAGRGATTNHYH
jgi:hypothetical protein